MSDKLLGTKSSVISDYRHSSPGGSRVNPIAVQDSVRDLVIAVTSGQKCGESLARLNQGGLWEKTSQGSGRARRDSSSGILSGTWSRWGIASDGEVGKLPTLELPTIGSVCSLWRTPNTMDSLAPKSQQALNHEAIDARPGRKEPNNLRDQVAVAEGITLWPTPAARDYKGQNSIEHINAGIAKGNAGHTNQLPNEILRRTGERGSLNPIWIEWLMGFPRGWTDLEVLETL
jgi:hypothetical protein